MNRALLIVCASLLAACGDDAATSGPIDPGPMNDAMISPVLDSGLIDEHMMIPMGPRDAAITEPTPILDLPLVIARPREPLSTASIDALVLDPMGEPVGDISVSTGGPAVITNAFGLARVSAVYGRDASDVYAFGARYTLTHARIPIRADEASQVVLVVAPVGQAWLEDSAAGGVVELTDLQVTFSPGAFELPWGGTAQGASSVNATVLDAAQEAASVPGGMLALIEGELVPLAGALSFELRVAQGATELALLHEASVVIPWAGAPAGIAAEQLTLYYFDTKASAFVPRGNLDLSAIGSALASIDRLGHWLIGSHALPAHCARADVQSAGTPLAHAGVVLTRDGAFGAARVEADAAGSGCALMPLGGPLHALALGKLGVQLVSAEGAVAASTEVAVCDAGCAPTVLQGEPLELGCVTGQLSVPWFGSSNSSVDVVEASVSRAVVVAANGAFCVDARAGAQLSFAVDSTFTCTNGGVLTASLPAASSSSCGGDATECLDVGAINCCNGQELCNGGGDDDCDGMTDEGCACAGADCTWLAATERCCAADGHCGERATFTGACVGLESFGIPIECPYVMVPTLEGGTTQASGCCRSSGECGVMWGSLGCVAAADVSNVWGPTVTLASVACMP